MVDRRRSRFGRVWVLGVMGLALSACGADPAPSADVPRLEAIEIAPVGDPTGPETSADGLDTPGTATALPERPDGRPAPATEGARAEVTPGPQQQELDQPAIWPAADVVYATPEEAAADFVSAVLISEGEPVLGEFQQGDARSGEIAVLFAGETGDLDPPMEMGVVALRQIAPTQGWYVIAAVSDGVMIDTPRGLQEVPAGTITVSGEGRGFEGTLAVAAFPPGNRDARLDLQIGAGGAFDELEPFSVELDLSGAADGDVVVIFVQGDTGLGSDPSTFSAFPVVIASAPPVTLPPTG